MGGTLPGEEEATRQVERDYNRQLLFTEAALDLALKAVDETCGRNIPCSSEDEVRFFQVLFGLFVKAIKACRSIQLLCSRGLASDSGALLRVIIETLISIKWICKEEHLNRTRLYFIHVLAVLNKAGNCYRANKELQELMPGLSDPYNNIAKRYNDTLAGLSENLKPKNKLYISKWSETSLETKAKQTDLGTLYDMAYRAESEAIHSEDIFSHAKFSSAGLHLFIRLPEGDVHKCLVMSGIALLDMLREVNRALGLGLEDEIARLEGQAPKRSNKGTAETADSTDS